MKSKGKTSTDQGFVQKVHLLPVHILAAPEAWGTFYFLATSMKHPLGARKQGKSGRNKNQRKAGSINYK